MKFFNFFKKEPLEVRKEKEIRFYIKYFTKEVDLANEKIDKCNNIMSHLYYWLEHIDEYELRGY